MSDGLTPDQLTTLCAVFFGFHILALPLFFWALRDRQFSGAEQRVWSLDDQETLSITQASKPPDPKRVRWMLSILMTFGTLMLSSILLMMVIALHATAHPGSATGKCPFF